MPPKRKRTETAEQPLDPLENVNPLSLAKRLQLHKKISNTSKLTKNNNNVPHPPKDKQLQEQQRKSTTIKDTPSQPKITRQKPHNPLAKKNTILTRQMAFKQQMERSKNNTCINDNQTNNVQEISTHKQIHDEDTDCTDPDNASDSDDDEEFNLDLQEFQDHTPGETDEDFEEQDLPDEPNERESEIQMLFQELLANGVLDRMLAKRNKMNIGPGSRNSDNLDDDEQDGDSDDFESINNHGAQEKHQPMTIELKIDDVPGGSEAFYDAASPDTYFIHPWPRGNGARASCLDLLKRLHNVKSDFATVTPETVQLYSKHIKERRTTLHQQVQKWLHEKYEPPVDIFPTEEIRRSKAKRFEYLAEESRFARENYLSTGALLQNTMLVDCMKYVYLNDGGHTGRRIQEIPAPTPKQLIVLIYVALLYKLTKFSQCPLYLEKETARDFGETSFYKTIFDQLVDDNTRSSRRVNWSQVQDMIRRETRQSSSDGGWSVLRALGEHWSDE